MGMEVSAKTTHSHDAELVEIMIGDKPYLISTVKIPYFGGFVRFCRFFGQFPNNQPLTHSAIPYIDIINHSLKYGLRSLIVNMPASAGIDEYHELCSTIGYLCIDVLRGRNAEGILDDLVMDVDFATFPGSVRRALHVARNSAFRLLYMLLMEEFDEKYDYDHVYYAVLLVLSARGVLAPTEGRFAGTIRQAFEERFVITDKQREALYRNQGYFEDVDSSETD